MDQQQIKTFIDAMAASDLREMEFSQDGWTLRLVRRPPDTAQPAGAVEEALPAAGAPVSLADATAPMLVAPLYGVVHLAPAAGEPPFVVAGQKVNLGQTLCVIEAMKILNEVRAEFDATLVDVLVDSGQEVDAGQPLMRFA